jgi:hypothetical protein
MITPRQVIIETTTRCNLSCPGCYRERAEGNLGIDMSEEVFDSLIDEISSWDPKPEVIPFCHGEPTLDPSFLRRLGDLSSKGLRWKFCSNGTTEWGGWDSVLSSDFCESILFSIDGWESKTIVEKRGLEGLRAPLQMQRLLKERARVGALKPWLGVRMRRTDQDFSEVEAFLRGWLEIGCDLVLVCRDVLQEPRRVESHPTCYYLLGRTMVVDVHGEVHPCDRRVPTIGTAKAGTWLETFNRVADGFSMSVLCRSCPQRYCGEGIAGEIQFRSDPTGKPVFFREDQFQQIFSRTDVREGVSWRK